MTAAIKKRPLAGSATGRVWEIADEMFRRSGALPSGRAVVDAYLFEDPSRNEGTGFTQYSHWKKAHLAQLRRGPRAATQGAGLRLGPDGQITLPPDILAALDAGPGARLVARVVSGEVRLVPAQAAIARARALVRAFDSGTGSPVDELIAERRSEAEQ